MFEIDTTSHFGEVQQIRLFDYLTGNYVSIIPEIGGNINEIILSSNERKFSIIDGAGTYSELIRDKMYKGIKLIPFPNRIRNGQYFFERASYQLPINFETHAIHGFIQNKNFKVKNKVITNTHTCLELEYTYDADEQGYPFKFKTMLQYSLIKDKGFVYNTKITNLDSSPIPIGDGWHPYFQTGDIVDRCMIKIPSNRRLEVDSQMIPTGKLIATDYNTFLKIGERNFDTGFFLGKRERKALTQIYDPKLKLTINIWQETGKWKYNYLQVFIPPSRKSIAVEPMTCAADAFNNKMGLIILNPKQSFSTSCGVFIS